MPFNPIHPGYWFQPTSRWGGGFSKLNTLYPGLVSNFSLLILFIEGLVFICLGYAISWPVKSFVFYDLWNMYVDVIQWRGMINTDLSDFPEIASLCGTMLEWIRIPYAIAMHIFLVSVIFRFEKFIVKLLKKWG